MDNDNEHLWELLEKIRVSPKDTTPRIFEPTQLYEQLESGELDQLQAACACISQYIGLSRTPPAEFCLSMELGKATSAGEFDTNTRTIRVPLAYVGDAHATGWILAHEIAHEYLIFERQVYLSDENANERLTDLCTIYLGLGVLVLNGLEWQPERVRTDVSREIGYVGWMDMAKFVLRWMDNHSIQLDHVRPFLSREAIDRLRPMRQ